ncbi:MAG TPA: FAD-dependent oxidoreductase [Burkholderiaceae bacterium]|nr:FAD-dependent oxidoreductase [Burkholderiaceae bacterium]
MKRVLLAGGGQAHVLVLREIARRHVTGIEWLLITPSHRLHYSGMLPGWIAGHYALEELTVDVKPLARAAGARLITAQVRQVDLRARTAVTDRGEALDFDVLAIATGAAIDVDTISGAREHAVPLRPFEEFVKQWPRIVSQAESARESYRLTVIGGGAGGAETALAAAYRGRTMRLPMQVQLLSGGVPILPGHGDRARALMRSALTSNSVQVLGKVAKRVEAEAVVTSDDQRLATDATLIATGASAAPWLRETGLALDERGFIAVNSHLQSTSHPFVFAAGDAAALIETPPPKSGVYAVRAAPPLAANLIAAATGEPLTSFEPQRRALYLLTTGPKHAIASWGAWAAAGRWVWHWKNRIDRDYIAKLSRRS